MYLMYFRERMQAFASRLGSSYGDTYGFFQIPGFKRNFLQDPTISEPSRLEINVFRESDTRSDRSELPLRPQPCVYKRVEVVVESERERGHTINN
jgi:hypothetical protein